MTLSIIVAMAQNGVIGSDNQLPWHLPEDLKHFKSLTMGKALIMGRKTFDSIGRPLPGRLSVVVTRQPDWGCEGVLVASSLDRAIELAGENGPAGANEIMIIGGGEIYRQALPLVSRLYVTRVGIRVEGDTCFPELEPGQWQLLSGEDKLSDTAGLNYRLETWERVS